MWLTTNYCYFMYCNSCLLVSCSDFNSSEELFITLKVLNERAMNSINTFLLNNLLH